MANTNNSANVGSKAAKGVGHVVNVVRNTVALVGNIAAQNYVGATVNGLQLLPYVIAILAFTMLAPFVIFMALPSMVIKNYSETFVPSNSITEGFVQNGISDIYGDYMNQLGGEIAGLKTRFEKGLLDSLISSDYSKYGSLFNLDISRAVHSNGVMVDVLWFSVLHSIHFGNDPANITAERTTQFISGFFAYQVSETITDVIEAVKKNPLTLLVMRKLDIELREPTQIMQHFGFDEQQIQWANFMHSVISNGSDSTILPGKPDYIPDGTNPIGITPGRLGEPIVNWKSYLTSGFGMRKDPFTGVQKHHSGIDIARPKGTEIYATMGGVVTKAAPFGTYGNTVMIDHGGGITTLYAHCSSVFVTVGQEVSQGEHIAAVGSTGRSNGNHLHFEYRINGRAVNPINYLS